MDLRQIKYFIAVAEEGNIGAAARRLHVSQPPVTRQIQSLEEELGLELFVRTHRGVTLTASGEIFLLHARRLADTFHSLKEKSTAAAEGRLGKLHLGYYGTAIYQTIPNLLRAFRTQYPDVEVSITQMPKVRQMEALRSGAIHIGFGRFYPYEDGVVVRPLGAESLIVAIPSHDALASKTALSVRDLVKRPILLFPKDGRPTFADEVSSILRHGGIEPHIADVVEDVHAALALTACGSGVSIVPASVAALRWPGVTFVPLSAESAVVPVSCVYLREHGSPVLSRLMEVLNELPFEVETPARGS